MTSKHPNEGSTLEEFLVENNVREKLKLTRAEANGILWSDSEDFKIISNEIFEHTRWSVHHELIVQRISDGKFFRSYYSKGATEYQDEEPWEYAEPEFIEVFPTQVTVTVYK